jgi:hypothetical protein
MSMGRTVLALSGDPPVRHCGSDLNLTLSCSSEN